MSQIADLVAYNIDGQITLIVEVKSRTDTSRSWATRMRRNILAHGVVPNSRFLLLALPDRFYLWKDAGNTPELIEPTYEIDATPFFQPYYERVNISPDQLSSQSFELIVTSWLNQLIQSGIPANVPESQRQLLQESGLLEALKGGTVTIEVPA
ncbi:MAG: hypothetical protein HC828_09970 [Blastochloris sp.]|nr:hypothetical protein [Blastochloris sp.]